jgi:hypothetical protein
MEKMSKQLESQANRLTRIEKIILPLQRSVDKIDKLSNTIKQLYAKVTQLQRTGAQNKKGKKHASRSKRKRSPSSR